MTLLDDWRRARCEALQAHAGPVSWEFTQATYLRMLAMPDFFQIDQDPAAHCVPPIGTRAAMTLFGLPVDIVPGAPVRWTLHTASGDEWEGTLHGVEHRPAAARRATARSLLTRAQPMPRCASSHMRRPARRTNG